MKKFAKVDPGCKTILSTAEIIANNADVETEVVNEDIEEGIHVTHSFYDDIEEKIPATHALIETTKSIQNLGLLKKKYHCDCYCCNRYDKMNDYTISFLKDLMRHDTEKFKEIGLFFTRLEEKRQETCGIQN